MKRDQLRKSANDQPASQFEDAAANDNLNETEMHEHESSAGVYERRLRHRTSIREEFLQETSWIVIALYLVIISIGFVAL
jgi:hypothetical protein